jgi:hypothetical protein
MFDGMGPVRLDDAPTGVELAQVLEELPAGDLGDDLLLSSTVAAYRQVQWAQAQFLEKLAELDRRCTEAFPQPPPGKAPLHSAADEFAAAMSVAPGTADHLVDLSSYLTAKLPRTLEALRRGETDLAKAMVVMDITASLAPEARRRVEDLALAISRTTTPRQLRAKLAAEAIKADPEGAHQRHEQAKKDRRVESYADPDGMGTLVARGTAEQTTAIFNVLDAEARSPRRAGDDRTADQRRMDALHDIVVHGKRRRGGHARVEVQVVVALSTLLGGDDAPALLKGYGPITSEQARAIARDARWRRLVTDPFDGSLLDYGSKVYRPPARLAGHVKARDLTCVSPACARDSRTCQLDHTENFPAGGTAEGNLGPGCERHHNCKTHGGWQCEQIEPGVFQWTSPLGRRYTVDRQSLLPFTPEPEPPSRNAIEPQQTEPDDEQEPPAA